MHHEEIPKLPEAFVQRTLAQFADGAALLAAIEQGTPCVGLRINPKKPVALPYRMTKLPWAKHGYLLEEPDARPGLSIWHFAGAFYLQEPSAMAAADLLEVTPGMRVLDLCAAPGGKSTQLATALQGQGLLLANEIDTSRVSALAFNLERFGITNAVVCNESPDRIANRFPAYFDRVLVDAPCSGEGMFRRDPASRRAWTDTAPAACARRQKAILHSASLCVAPYGKMVYSTCTFNKEENEQVIADFLASHEDFALEEASRIVPHKQPGEGHFFARLCRTGGQRSTPLPLFHTDDAYRASWRTLAKDVLADASLQEIPLLRLGDWLCAPPIGCPAPDGLHIVRAGVQVASVHKARLEPAHALAMSLRPEQANRWIDLSDAHAAGYLQGNPLPTSAPNGWTYVCYQGLPIGWGKVSEGILKNHIPKGLRTKG